MTFRSISKISFRGQLLGIVAIGIFGLALTSAITTAWATSNRTRALMIKEQRAELVKHHLWVLWTDYFKPPHFEAHPQLHTLFNEATKLAGAAGAKGSLDAGKADELLAKIDEIAEIFWETKKS